MKVFGIGLSRTGTTSLTLALARLGLHSHHFPRSREVIAAADAATDTPVAVAFRELDAEYPGSKFVLTTRRLPDWLDSCEALWKAHPNGFDPFASDIHRRIYGREDFDRIAFAEAYARHHAAVLAHFAGRDLLLLDVCAGEGWAKLCPFLGYDIPPDEFPRRNPRAGLGNDWVFNCPPYGTPVPRRDWTA